MIKTETDKRERVPHDSKLLLRVTSQGGKLGCGADLFTSGSPHEHWSQHLIHPGPKRKTLKSSKVYLLQVNATLMAKERVDVDIEIRTPDGNVHGGPIHWELDGKQGDQLIGNLFVKTLRKAAKKASKKKTSKKKRGSQ
jgi:hypothetical protein